MRIFAGRMLFLAVLVVLLPGCVRVSALPLGEKLKACELKEGTVRIFHGELKERYTALAIVTAQTAWWAPASWEDLLHGLCVEAARLGANAVIRLTLGKLDYSLTVGPVGRGGDTRELTGVAVRLE
jgi:hypothetical protein